ncbi:PAS domain-containing protein [Mucilaginibacter paludis]|uniref:PAS fold-4 domain protein n=1 Tax=Mucilaginibacter paludis DSM 18603 TaxID=714943 RepID=H1Y7U5_9SPHI|nr:PAS domain-containing protein [Mucilaginibacter paludis]EHQ30431.1 PAS fold-4 domain protein [Mucilaginibacter paludis DSM 18603]
MRLQAELDKLSLKYNAVFNSLQSYHIILDKHLNVVDFNEASVGLIKTVFNKQIKIGQPVINYLNDELADQLLTNCRRALAGETFTVERKLNLINNIPTWWMAEYAPAYDTTRQIAGLVFNATDITTRKNYEAKIELQNAKLRAISLMQSHDIRGPVCTLMGLLNLLRDEGMMEKSIYLPLMEATIQELDKQVSNIVECAAGL